MGPKMHVIFVDFYKKLCDISLQKTNAVAHHGKQNLLVCRNSQILLMFL